MARTPEEKQTASCEYQRRYRETHREERRENQRNYAKRHPERVKIAGRAAKLRWHKAHPDQMYLYRIKCKFGITVEEAEQVLAARKQDICAICGGNRTKRLLHVDHNHATGKIRGVLCGKCNAVLGFMDDNSVWLRKAADYIDDAG